jgi:UDP-N-acetylglucosamine 1-carboxyvinyltransferase
MGADIIGAGTDVIKIHGVSRLRGRSYSVILDQIEAGTYIAAVAATGGEVVIKNVIPKHLDCITAKFSEMGVRFESYEDSIRVISTGRLTKTNIKSLPYPSFPTDMQPQISAVHLRVGTHSLQFIEIFKPAVKDALGNHRSALGDAENG